MCPIAVISEIRRDYFALTLFTRLNIQCPDEVTIVITAYLPDAVFCRTIKLFLKQNDFKILIDLKQYVYIYIYIFTHRFNLL